MARLTLMLGCLTVFLACCETADAQRRPPRRPMYQTRGPLSPYASLFRGDNAGLNSYFSVVRPRLALNDYIRQSEFEFAAQQQMIDQRSLMLQQELTHTLNAMDMGLDTTSTGLQVRPTTGSGALRRPPGTFMNTSTFFPSSTMTSGPGTGPGAGTAPGIRYR